MKNSEKVAASANVGDGAEPTSRSEAIRVFDGKRSASDQRRFQDALEDDEVRDALRVRRGTNSPPRGGRRP